MDVVKTFGRYVDDWSMTHPDRARWLLKTGWKLQGWRFKHFPDKRLFPSERYLAVLMMDAMTAPLDHPDRSALVSIFTPCELLQEVGLSPYNVESFSCYLNGSQAEGAFLQKAEEGGLSETLCSYHKTFLGAAETGLLPPPKCIVYTNLTCDANLLTFPALGEFYGVPSFPIDVPQAQTADSVAYVANQLRELSRFLEDITGKQVDAAALKTRLDRSRRSLENIAAYQKARADRYVPEDLVSPLYSSMTANILLGTEGEERYTQMLLEDVKTAPPAHGTRLYWMHTLPFWSEAMKDALLLSDKAQIVGCELGQCYDLEGGWSDDPYEAMAIRMVYHSLNGSAHRRIQAGVRHAKETGADGAVWFCHWGCKHTLGAARLAKEQFEAAGLPLLILDGDGCDRSRGSEGQTATRLGAFLEMLEERKAEPHGE